MELEQGPSGDQLLPERLGGGENWKVEDKEDPHPEDRDCAEHLGKISWVRGEKAVRASIVLQQRAAGRPSKDLKETIVVVPACWQFLSRFEKLRDETDTEVLCEFISHWQYWELLAHSGLDNS